MKNKKEKTEPEVEDITVFETEPEAVDQSPVVYLQDKAQIDVQISTAKAYPRNPMKSLNNALAIITMDQETASTCTYSLPRGGKNISGPSVHLARVLAQTWGNLRVDSRIVSIENAMITAESVTFDLENNLAIRTQVKRRITDKKGIRFNDDMITVTGNAAAAIAMRNSILAVIPKSVINKAYRAAIQVITGDVSTENALIAARKRVFDGLVNTYDLEISEILEAIHRKAMTHVTAEDIAILVGYGQAIKDGDTTVDQVFRPKKAAADEIKADKNLNRSEAILRATTTSTEFMTAWASIPDELKIQLEEVFSELSTKFM